MMSATYLQIVPAKRVYLYMYSGKEKQINKNVNSKTITIKKK